MGRPTTYCDQCGAMIPGADFDKGAAFSERGKNYCAECAPKIPRAAPGDRDKQGSTRTRRQAVESQRDSDIIRNLQGLGARPQTTRISHEHAPAPAARGPSPAVLGAAAGGALLLVLLLVFAFSGSGDGGGASSQTEAAALAACEAAEAQRGKIPAKEWLALATTARKTAEGTRHQNRAAAIHREAQAAVEADEKVQKIASDLARLVQEARAASKPEIYLSEFDRLREAARRDAPALVAKVDEEAASLCTWMLLRQVEQVDLGLAGTPHGYRRVLESLDELAKKSGSKATADAIAKKRAAAKEAFEKGGAEAAADLDRRLQMMLKDGRHEEAERAVKMFEDDYRGTSVESKAAELRGVVAKAREAFEKSWSAPALGDFAKDLGDAKATEAGGVITLSHDGAEAAVADDTRRISFAKNDREWGDYELRFEVLLEKVGTVLLMRTMSNPPIRVNLPVQVGASQGLPAGRWYKVTVKVVGKQAELGGDLTPVKAEVADGTGGFAFVVQPGARFQIRNVKARQIK